MNLKKLALGVGAAAICLGAASAQATETEVLPGFETPLDTLVANWASANSTTVKRVNDDLDSTWWTLSGGTAQVLATIAGNPNDLYTAAIDGALGIQILSKTDSGTKTFSISGDFLFADVTTDGYRSSSTGLKYFVTDATLNGDEDHSVTYQVLGMKDTYIIAWEDLKFGNSGCDHDYNDLVVVVQGVKPVPDGATTMMLLGGALCGMGAIRRRMGL